MDLFYSAPVAQVRARRMLHVVSCLVLQAILACGHAMAQVSPVGYDPRSSYDSGTDNIDLATLNVHIEIPLYERKGRGSGTDQSIRLVYDNAYISGPLPGIYDLVDIGWQIGLPSQGSLSYTTSQVVCGNDQAGNNLYTTLHFWVFVDGNGVLHNFPGQSTTSDCDASAASVVLDTYPSDQSPYHLKAQGDGGSITLPSGATVSGYTYTDSNGNQITPWIADTSGQPPSITGGGLNNYTSTPTARNPTLITYKDTNGTSQTVTVSYRWVQIDYQALTGTPNNNPNNPFLPYVGLVDRLTFPDGSYYSCTYEPSTQHAGTVTGRLASLTLPSGGVISYTYPSDASSNVGYFSTLGRQGPEGSTSYQRVFPEAGNAAKWTTKILRQSAVGGTPEETDVTFVTNNWARGMETSRKVFSGAAGGTPLLSTTRCYNGATGDCTWSGAALPITEIDETRSYNGGPATRTTTFYNLAHLVTESDEYDAGASIPTRKTLTTYSSLGNNIADRPASITVQDGAGNIFRKTTFDYDSYGLSTPTGATPSRIDVSGARGNLTIKHDWASSGVSFDTLYEYDLAGQLVKQTDPRSNPTSFTYDSGTDTVVASLTRPPTNGVNHYSTVQVNVYTGLPSSSVDENGNQTSYDYDGDLRPHCAKAALGTSAEAWTCYSYPSATQRSTASDKDAKGDQVLTTSVLYDGYGRQTSTTRPDGNVVDTAYDVRSRVHFVSNPHSPNATGTQGQATDYDALGRPVTIYDADGHSSKTISYWQLSRTETDESGNQRKYTYDGLGRLVQTLEPDASGNPTISTTYSYNPADNLTQVVQNGAGDGSARTRTFSYDWLSRVSVANNPETGPVCYGTWSGGTVGAGDCQYGYDGNGNALAKTDARGVTLAYSYDALNRLISKTGNLGTIRSSCYQYDTAGPSIAVANGIGYLTGSWTMNGSCPSGLQSLPYSGATTWRSIIQYDPYGRALGDRQCAHAPCDQAGTLASTTLGYTYNLAGSTTSSTNGVVGSVALNYSYDAGGRLSTLSDARYPNASLFRADAYDPFGVTGYSLGAPVTGVATVVGALTRDALGRTISAKASIAPLTAALTAGVPVASTFPTVTAHVDCASACGNAVLQIDNYASQTVPLDASGNATYQFGIALTAGSHMLTATYQGSAGNTNSVTVPFTVQTSTLPATRLYAALATNPVASTDNAVPLVSLGCTTACGSVSIASSGGAVLQTVAVQSDGSVSFNSIPASQLTGSSLTVAYSGDSSHAPASTNLSFSVQPSVPPMTCWFAPGTPFGVSSEVDMRIDLPELADPNGPTYLNYKNQFLEDGVLFDFIQFYNTGLGHKTYLGGRVVGWHILTAQFPAQGSFAAQSCSTPYNIVPDSALAPANLVAHASPSPVTQSGSITLTSSIACTANCGTAYAAMDGVYVLTIGTSSTSGALPQRTFSASGYSIGNHTLSVYYPGDQSHRYERVDIPIQVVN